MFTKDSQLCSLKTHFNMKSTIFAFALLLFLLTSCGKQSSDYKSLKAQNDSLQNEKIKHQEEVDGYFSAKNQIEQNIEKIKSTENVISVQPVGKELNEDVRTKINDDMTYINDMLQTNKAELARPSAFNLNIDDYVKFLLSGVDEF